jgi:plastocyanin
MNRLISVSLVGLVLTGCGGGGAVGPPDETGTLSSLEVTPGSATIAEGGTVQLAVVPLDETGNILTGLQAASFSSSDPTVASVDVAGLVSGVREGTATIAISLSADGVTEGSTASITVTRSPQPGANLVTTVGVTFSPSSITIAESDSVIWSFEGAVHNVTFSGATPAGGNIPDQPTGVAVARTFTVAGTYPYQCTIHAGMTGDVIVTSAATPVYSTLSVSPATPSLEVAESVALAATPLDQHGNAMPGLAAPTWQSNDPGIATVTQGGIVEGVAPGTVDIVATLTASGVTHTGASVVTVLGPQPGSATVATLDRIFNPSTVVIEPGNTITWQFSESIHNVTFTGQAPSGGNIPDQAPGNAVSRTFTTEGTYDYNCTYHSGMEGRVVVQTGAPPPPLPGVIVSVADQAFSPDRIEIAVGETVTWQFVDDTYNVTFDGDEPPGGDIPDSGPGTSASRTFPVAGDYDYVSTLHDGMRGRVRVR